MEKENVFLWHAKLAISTLTASILFFTAVAFYFLEPIPANLEDIAIAVPTLAISSLLLLLLDVKYKKVKAGYFHYFLNSLPYLFLVIPFWIMLATIAASGGKPLLTLVFFDVILVITILLSLFNPRIKALQRRSVELDNSEVRQGVKDISLRMGVKVSGIKVIDSDKVKIANAFQTGLIHSYVFLTSFLVKNLTTNENIAIIAHELAHSQKKHVQKTFLFLGIEIGMLGNIFFLLTVFLFGYSVRVGMVVGIFASIFVSVYIFLPLLQRRFEKEADIVAANYTQPRYLIDSLQKISKLNHVPLNIPRYWNTSHPSTSERIDYLSNLKNGVEKRDESNS